MCRGNIVLSNLLDSIQRYVGPRCAGSRKTRRSGPMSGRWQRSTNDVVESHALLHFTRGRRWIYRSDIIIPANLPDGMVRVFDGG